MELHRKTLTFRDLRYDPWAGGWWTLEVDCESITPTHMDIGKDGAVWAGHYGWPDVKGFFRAYLVRPLGHPVPKNGTIGRGVRRQVAAAASAEVV